MQQYVQYFLYNVYYIWLYNVYYILLEVLYLFTKCLTFDICHKHTIVLFSNKFHCYIAINIMFTPWYCHSWISFNMNISWPFHFISENYSLNIILFQQSENIILLQQYLQYYLNNIYCILLEVLHFFNGAKIKLSS